MLSVGLTRFPGRLDRPYSSMRRLMLETVISPVRTLETLSFALLALQSPVYGKTLIRLQRNIFVQDIRKLNTCYIVNDEGENEGLAWLKFGETA